MSRKRFLHNNSFYIRAFLILFLNLLSPAVCKNAACVSGYECGWIMCLCLMFKKSPTSRQIVTPQVSFVDWILFSFPNIWQVGLMVHLTLWTYKASFSCSSVQDGFKRQAALWRGSEYIVYFWLIHCKRNLFWIIVTWGSLTSKALVEPRKRPDRLTL